VDEALYGRMRVGRCVQRSLGYVDCQADVLEHIEVLCSGHRHCAARMPDDSIYDTQPCPPDVTSYLEVTYRCLNGMEQWFPGMLVLAPVLVLEISDLDLVFVLETLVFVNIRGGF